MRLFFLISKGTPTGRRVGLAFVYISLNYAVNVALKNALNAQTFTLLKNYRFLFLEATPWTPQGRYGEKSLRREGQRYPKRSSIGLNFGKKADILPIIVLKTMRFLG